MRVSLARSEIKGAAAVPASKSYTIRALFGAALADGISEIVHPLAADDTAAAAEVLGKIGVGVEKGAEAWRVSGGRLRAPESELFCGDSAATLRFMTAVSALVPGKCRLTAGQSLSRRPVGVLVAALRQLGVDCSSRGDFPPVTVTGGRLAGGTVALPGDISSQFVSALLLVAPRAEQGLTVRLTSPLESRSYVLMTVECLAHFGIRVQATADGGFTVSKQDYRPARYAVEGDWSAAACLLALGAAGGEVAVSNLNPESLQGDKIMLDFLREMGAGVNVAADKVTVTRSALRAIKADLSECIDLLPALAALAATADGVSEFTGIRRARLKESDRVAAVRQGLAGMGIATAEGPDRLSVTGGKPRGAVIDSRGDHRIAMALSVLGAVAGDTVIDGAECVAKTFPRFWAILEKIGGRLTKNGEQPG